jgi:hypothetical protein
MVVVRRNARAAIKTLVARPVLLVLYRTSRYQDGR